ncbi:hypothetical protein TNCV_2165351 [Trichonephila clavipes]|nr:hypothetical protein TNCV_2165351 [Trichonephila clavipes]
MGNILEASILSSKLLGEVVLLPHTDPNDSFRLIYSFKCLQFPIRLVFAMTINKLQGQTMTICGLDFENPCFSHYQLYVASPRLCSLKMPQKQKSGLSKNSSRARAAKVARNQESSVHAELRRQQQAQRQSILRTAETPLQARVHSETQAELQVARRAIEMPEQSQIFKSAIDNWHSDNYKVVIHSDRTPHGEHERRYNSPMVNEVAVLVTGKPFSSRGIVLRAHDNTLQRIADTHEFYDALQYPLIFSKGEPGYHFNIPVVSPTTEQPIPSKQVSCMDFYAYYMMLREHDFNLLLRTRQLFHQFLVDMYIKVESEHLHYIALNRKKLRAENYIHLQDAISADDNIRPNDIGKMVILASTFVNSPRYLQEYTHLLMYELMEGLTSS